MHSVHKNMKACSLVFKYEREEPSREDHRSTSRSLLHSHSHVNSRSLVRRYARSRFLAQCKNSVVPNRGIASETWGRVSATRFRNTVSDSKMVTPETVVAHLCSMIRSRWRSFASGVDGRVVTSASSTWKTRSSRYFLARRSTKNRPELNRPSLANVGFIRGGEKRGFDRVFDRKPNEFCNCTSSRWNCRRSSRGCLLAVLSDMMFSR